MKVRTFTGSETAKVDKRVNDWLAEFGIKPHHTNTAIGQFTVKAEDQHTGKPVNRRVAVIAISVWYEEPAETGVGGRRDEGENLHRKRDGQSGQTGQ